MNVSCTNCGKRYVLSDDKVAGKASVKIRCKQCQSLISIDVAQAAASSPSGVMAAPQASRPSGAVSMGGVQAPTRSPWEDEATKAMPALDLSAQWHAMIGGVQQGPFDVKALMGKVTAGEVTLRTYLWKAGMADWKRAAEVAEVSSLFAGAPPVSSSPSQTGRPPTKPSLPAVPRKDVAVANEMPSPEVTKPKGGNVADALPAHQLDEAPSGNAAAAFEAPSEPHAQPKSEPLNDLFSDVPKSSGVSGLHAQQPSTSGLNETPSQQSIAGASGEVDPFAAMGEASDKELPPPGEATKFFIAQAGVNKRNPPWKIALFALSIIGLPTAVLYLLSSFKVVELNVERTTEDGQVVQESFFSPGGVSGLKDMLTGDAKRKKEEAERKDREREAAIAASKRAQIAAANPNAAGTTADPVVAPKPVDPSLAALYEDTEKKDKGPRDREKLAGALASSGLKDEVAMKVVSDNIKAFNLCIEEALRRNPNLKVGSIVVKLTVGQSGAVKAANIDPGIHETTDWGGCMLKAGRRIVFPASDGETEVQVPLKLGVSM